MCVWCVVCCVCGVCRCVCVCNIRILHVCMSPFIQECINDCSVHESRNLEGSCSKSVKKNVLYLMEGYLG